MGSAQLGPEAARSAVEDDPEFDAILDRRLADHESGNDPGVPAEEVFRKLRERHG